MDNNDDGFVDFEEVEIAALLCDTTFSAFDSDGDGIHNSYNGYDFINLGTDYLGNPINDYRSPISYPYDFAGNIGNALSVTDTCQVFNFNINFLLHVFFCILKF